MRNCSIVVADSFVTCAQRCATKKNHPHFPLSTPASPQFTHRLRMSSNSIPTRELYDRFVMPTYSRFDLRLARGHGAEVWDEEGRRYLDFGAGIAVTSIGHCHPRVVAALRAQVGTLVHTSNLY